jgi:hypothetical protein
LTASPARQQDRAMRLLRSLSALVLLAVALLVPASAGAQSVTSEEQIAIQGTIRAQMEAFLHDDGEAAYALAAPGIKALYPTVDSFMRMVKGRYQPVYRPGNVVFGTVTATPQGPVQRVFVTGPDGLPYIANYALQRQDDGSWKISGCTVTRDRASSAI